MKILVGIFAAFLALLSAGMLWEHLQPLREHGTQRKQKLEGREFGEAIHRYASDHDGRYPEKLEELVSQYLPAHVVAPDGGSLLGSDGDEWRYFPPKASRPDQRAIMLQLRFEGFDYGSGEWSVSVRYDLDIEVEYRVDFGRMYFRHWSALAGALIALLTLEWLSAWRGRPHNHALIFGLVFWLFGRFLWHQAFAFQPMLQAVGFPDFEWVDLVTVLILYLALPFLGIAVSVGAVSGLCVFFLDRGRGMILRWMRLLVMTGVTGLMMYDVFRCHRSLGFLPALHEEEAARYYEGRAEIPGPALVAALAVVRDRIGSKPAGKFRSGFIELDFFLLESPTRSQRKALLEAGMDGVATQSLDRYGPPPPWKYGENDIVLAVSPSGPSDGPWKRLHVHVFQRDWTVADPTNYTVQIRESSDGKFVAEIVGDAGGADAD